MPTPYDSKEFFELLKWRQKTNSQLLEVSNCISSWTDICGFGSLLEQNKWSLENLQSSGVVALLNEFHLIAGQPLLINIDPFPHDKIIVLNDGIARTVDLTHKSKIDSYSFLMFLRNLIFTHYSLLTVTSKYKVGIRTILAGGERIQYSPAYTTGHSVLYYNEGKINDFGKELLSTTFVYNPAEFQMNTAFAKAYTIDSLGTKKHIRVNGFYIESEFLEKIDGLNGVTFTKEEKSIKFFHKGILVFDLIIADTLQHNLKGLEVTIYHIHKYLIHKAFDGDDLEFDLYTVDSETDKHTFPFPG